MSNSRAGTDHQIACGRTQVHFHWSYLEQASNGPPPPNPNGHPGSHTLVMICQGCIQYSLKIMSTLIWLGLLSRSRTYLLFFQMNPSLWEMSSLHIGFKTQQYRHFHIDGIQVEDKLRVLLLPWF